MHIWHDTLDAPRTPRCVSPDQFLEVIVGTWPIGPKQSVWVTWHVVPREGDSTHGRVEADWRYNSGVNSYWSVRLGPFRDGTCVTYTVHGACSGNEVETGPVSFRVRPALYVAWLWHQHQPLYRDPAAPSAAGSYRYPWVRLHALRDYYSMAALAAEHDVHVTFNFTPVLLQQIDGYVEHGATDRALELTRQPAEELGPRQTREILSTFFDADWHHQVYVHPRYRELLERRISGRRFSSEEIRDLQMWFNLAWFGDEFRSGPVRLITGDTVDVSRFVRQERGFSHEDVLAMVDAQYKLLRAVVPLHRALQDTGQIEVSTTPAFHPILPLLIDTDQAALDRPGAALPTRYAHPDDAVAQVDIARRDYGTRFGRPPIGVWPAEGAVSAEVARLLGREGIGWIATDAGVLARSGQWGYRVSEASVLCQPYRASDDTAPLAIFFRDTDLSDGVGFRYGRYADPEAAVQDLLQTIETRYLDRSTDDGDQVLTIALDGENAWGAYRDDGRPFLRALYRRLSSDSRLKTVTFSEYLRGNPDRDIAPHPTSQLARVYNLATGSWIDEPGSSPGVDLGTWIGEPEENAAWNLLGEARSALGAASASAPAVERAYQSLLAAQGSDWFWWFGGDQESRNDAAFDDLFRAHVRAVYHALDLAVPEAVDNGIVARPAVWTFTHPEPTIPRRGQVSIRTNCPGRLTYRVDEAAEDVVRLVAVGGVMAGVRRFQVTLGPFADSAQRIVFRFFCEHAECAHDSPCCHSDTQAITIGGRRRGRDRASIATDGNTPARGSHADTL